MHDKTDQDNQLLYRLSTGVLGAIVVAIASLVLLTITSWFGVSTYTYPHALLAGSIAGGAIGVLFPAAVMPAFVGIIYFLYGLFAMFLPSGLKIERPPGGGRFFWIAFIFGALFYFLLWSLPGGTVHAHTR